MSLERWIGTNSASLIQLLQKLVGTQCFIKEQSSISFKSSKEKKRIQASNSVGQAKHLPHVGGGQGLYIQVANEHETNTWQIHWNRDVAVSPPALECCGFEGLHRNTGLLLLAVPHPPSIRPHALEDTLNKDLPSKRSLDTTIKIKGDSDETCPLALPQGFSSLV